MPNGSRGDHPLTDILQHNVEVDHQWHLHAIISISGADVFGNNVILQENGVDEIPGHPETRHKISP
jgi:hypothetical protein